MDGKLFGKLTLSWEFLHSEIDHFDYYAIIISWKCKFIINLMIGEMYLFALFIKVKQQSMKLWEQLFKKSFLARNNTLVYAASVGESFRVRQNFFLQAAAMTGWPHFAENALMSGLKCDCP